MLRGEGLNSFKGVTWGTIPGSIQEAIKGDTRSSDHGSHVFGGPNRFLHGYFNVGP